MLDPFFRFFLLSLHGRTVIFSSVRHGFEFLQCGALPVMCFGFLNLTNSSYKYHKPIIVIGVMFTNLANHIYKSALNQKFPYVCFLDHHFTMIFQLFHHFSMVFLGFSYVFSVG